MFRRTEPENMNGVYGIMLIELRRVCKPISEIFTPSSRIFPPFCIVLIRKSAYRSEDLPAPVLPIQPTVSPP